MRRLRLSRLLAMACLLLAACLLHGTAIAADTGRVLRLADAPTYDLSAHADFLEDDTGGLTIDEIRQPAQQARFRPVPVSGPGANFGLTRSAIWLRVRLDAPAGPDTRWLLELGYPPLDRVELWSPDEGFGLHRQIGGDLQPYASRVVPHRNHVFPVTLPPATTTTLYLRIASQGTVSAPLRLWRPAALWQADQREYAALSLYFGLLVGLLLYNLLLYLSVRDTAYLVYVLFVAGMGTAQAALTGIGLQFLWTEHIWWNSVSPPAGMCAAAIFAMQFARSFLASRQTMPTVDKLLLALIVGWVVALGTALLLPYIVSSILVTVLAPLAVLVLVSAGVVGMRRGLGGAREFMAAWSVLLIGVFSLFLHNTGQVPSNAVTSNALLIGSALEMVLLSFALGNRINVARRFKEQAQARIAAEQAMVQTLSTSQQRLRTLLDERETILDTSIVGIAFLTPQGRFKWANRAMMDIFGATEASLVESMEPYYLSREQYLEVGGGVAQAVSRGEVYANELQMQRSDGTRIWVSLAGRSVSRHDLAQGTVWVIMDITRRKELEAALQRTSSEREAILNNAVVGIVLSVRRRHEWVNEKFARMLGYPREELIGRTSDYIHPDRESWDRFGVEARAALVATNGYTCERQIRRADGSLFWAEMGGSCIKPNDPDSGVIWTLLDITGRKKSEAEMREALEQQKALNELRSRFVAMTSHEFRTPLAAIRSAEELLRHYGDRMDHADRVETLDSIASGVDRMSKMLDRVLLIGRADAEMLDCQPGDLDLRALCRIMVEEARIQHPESHCEVVASFSAGVGRGRFDEKLLRHIFGNLLSNAIKYSPAGGQVRFNVIREETATVFEVGDQGIGIPADEVPHLFGSFHRASNVGAIPGTGLGLAIVKNAVDAHGGTIEVTSVVGEGTTFVVRIPHVG
ncbi:7TM diverse intracellular signaling domain-containing protein [Ramlibacter sp.]|uniref:7TM diverse intracellular signaling domain-containing protein n=1 Tax=Ramlibacter sp. TaxID=1917967 RepID=UPI0035B1F84A